MKLVLIVSFIVAGWFVLGVLGDFLLWLGVRRMGLQAAWWPPNGLTFFGPVNFLIGIGFLVFVFGSELISWMKKR